VCRVINLLLDKTLNGGGGRTSYGGQTDVVLKKSSAAERERRTRSWGRESAVGDPGEKSSVHKCKPK